MLIKLLIIFLLEEQTNLFISFLDEIENPLCPENICFQHVFPEGENK